MAMSAIGLKTNLIAMIKSSGKSILLGALCWIAIILTSLGMQSLIGIFLRKREPKATFFVQELNVYVLS